MRLRSSKQKQTRDYSAQPRRRSPITKYYRSDETVGTASPFSKKATRKSSRRFFFGFLDIVLIAIVLFGIFYSLLIKPKPTVIVNDTSFHSQSDYTDSVSSLFHAIKNRNKITFDEKALIADLQKKYPEISNAQIELPFFSQKPIVRLAVAEPSFVLKNHTANYVVNSKGTAVSRTNNVSGSARLVTIDDQSGFNVKPGNRVLGTSSVTFIDNLIRQCRKANVEIKSLTIPQAPQELILKTKDQNYYVKFYLGGNVETQAGQFLAARKYFKDIHKNPATYLDVRVEGKIFYK